MIRFEGAPLPPSDPKLKRAAAIPGGKDRPAVTPVLEAKVNRIIAPINVTKKIVTENAGVTKNRGRPKKDATMSQADRAKAYRKRRKASAP
jgi:hypothetical protein